jgi:hypothetical protein
MQSRTLEERKAIAAKSVATRQKNMQEYTRIVKHIDLQKNYRCLASEFMEIDNYGD